MVSPLAVAMVLLGHDGQVEVPELDGCNVVRLGPRSEMRELEGDGADAVAVVIDGSLADHEQAVAELVVGAGDRPVVVGLAPTVASPDALERAMRLGVEDAVALTAPDTLVSALRKAVVRAERIGGPLARHTSLLSRLEAMAAGAEDARSIADGVARELAVAFGASVRIDIPVDELPDLTVASRVGWPPDATPGDDPTQVPLPGLLSAGGLTVGAAEPLGPEELHLLQHAAIILGEALLRLELGTRLAERGKELAALHTLVRGLLTTDDLETACATVADRLAVSFRYPELTRVEVAVDGSAATAGVDGQEHRALERPVTLAGEARGTLRVVYVDDADFLDPEEVDLLASTADLLAGWLERQGHERRMIALFEHTLDAITFVDDDARIVEANPAAARLLGTTTDALMGVSLAQLYLPSEASDEAFASVWEQFRADGRLSGEFAVSRPDGQQLQVEVAAVSEALPGLHLLTARDVTERHRAERELRASEARFRDIAEHTAEGIFVQRFVPHPHFSYANPAVARTLGCAVEDIYDDPAVLLDAISDEDRARMWDALDRADAIADPVDVDVHRRDGGVVRVRMRATPIRAADGRITALFAVATDVTREHAEQEALRTTIEHQRRVAQELRELTDLKTGFVQAVSHELRTPLTSLRGFTELLLHRDMPRDEQLRYLERMQSGAIKLHRLVEDVLDLDRFEHPRRPLAAEQVDLADLVHRVVDEVETGTHDVQLDLEAAEASADAALIERIVENLLRNALAHTPAGTTVWLRTRRPATIIVEDDGPGIPADLHDQMFEPFQQGPDRLDRHSPGTGVGLALSRRIARLHDGDIHLADRPGGGARFVTTLAAP